MMTEVVNMETARLGLAVKRGYRNWRSQFQEDFGLETRLSDLSARTLALLCQGRDRSTFYIFDLIMNLKNLGSGLEFTDLNTKEKMALMDRYLFLLDRIRFEYMKRLGWLEEYPGEECSIVELITQYERLAPGLEAKVPQLSQDHEAYQEFCNMNAFEREELIRKLIPKALKALQDHSTTL
ncbi:MAG: hypothetical protein MUO52_08485 [Desulfobacterales bacterium]|nr:hypothetical protein [Desulfobacterales bacterium]